jgi:hypothetical protein
MSTHLYKQTYKTAAKAVAVINQRGEAGITFLNTTGVASGSWNAIQCISACAFTTLVADNNDGAALQTITLTAGVTIYGHFTQITLASGSVIAYKD